MKNLYKFFLALGVCTSAFSQITEITKLPVQDISQSCQIAKWKTMNFISSLFLFVLIINFKIFAQYETIQEFPKAYSSQDIRELTPVWISENEILVFYTNATTDTIFSRRTTNRGNNWSPQKIEESQIEKSPYQQEYKLFLTAIVGHNGRILLAFSGKIVYSDDNGLTWNESTLPHPDFFTKYGKLSRLTNNRIQFCCVDAGRNLFISNDNGETWSTDNRILIPGNPPGYPQGDFGVVVISDDSLLVISGTRNIMHTPMYSSISTDFGETWSARTLITELSIIHEADTFYGWYYGPKICLEADAQKNIYLFFDQSFDTGYDSIRQHDIGVLMTSDFGITWHQEPNFTKYLGHDLLDNISILNGKLLITFFSSRSTGSVEYPYGKQNFFGVYGQSQDTFTPPVVLSQRVTDVDYEMEEFDYRVLVVDDDAVSQVYLSLENDAYQSQMFDDGLHNDSLANDNIYGNTFPILQPSSVIPYYGSIYSIDVNKINLPLNNKGILADVNYSHLRLIAKFDLEDIAGNLGISEQIVEVPVQNPGSLGKFEEGAFLFSGGFFLSGYSNGEMWSNAVASSSLVEDYLAGEVGSEPNYNMNRIYIVNKDQKPFGYSWKNWKEAVSLGAEFYDGDRDGIYNPVDKNWNGTWDINEDMPMLIGDETVWCVYNDGLPKNQRRWNTVEPQGIEVRQTIFASDNPELENVIFIRYSILNTGTAAVFMDSVYFGIWEDGDLGDATDDVVGCDTLLNSGFYYADEPDGQYGENPPAFFSTFLQGPIIETNENSDTATINYGQLLGSERTVGQKNIGISSHVFIIGGSPNLNDPGTATDARNYILGKDRLGDYPNPCNWPYGEVRGGVDCHEVNPGYWFSGDPVTNVGWICDQNRDTRNLVSTGPFQLEKDKPQEIIIAYVIGRGNNPLNSVTVARENVQRAMQEYQSNFASMTYTPPAPTSPVTNYVLYQNYPNPFNPTTTIRYELPQDGVVTIEVFDILGQKVKTILNEFKKADRYEVSFSSTGLASGVYIYQLRVNEFITSKKMMMLK